MNISFRISVLLIMLFSIIAPRCHALSDYAGQGKAPLTWNELMNHRVDPSRYFATPGGGHGVHPAGGYDAPQAVSKAKPDQTVKPDTKPPMPHIPLVPAPKPQPEVKPEVKPEPKPDCKPEPEAKEHKCWRFKPFKPECKPEKKDRPSCHPEAKPEHRPSCKPDKAPSCQPDHNKSGDKPGCKPSGMRGQPNGHGFGIGRHGHGVGKGVGHGHGR